MAAERNFFHRWRGMTTIGYELGVIWEMSANTVFGDELPDLVCDGAQQIIKQAGQSQ